MFENDKSLLPERQRLLQQIAAHYPMQDKPPRRINEAIFQVLYNSYYNLTGTHLILKSLFQILSQEVKESVVQKHGQEMDFEEIVFLLHDYAFKFDSDHEALAIVFGKFLYADGSGIYDSREEMVQDFISMLILSNQIDDIEDEHLELTHEIEKLIHMEIGGEEE